MRKKSSFLHLSESLCSQQSCFFNGSSLNSPEVKRRSSSLNVSGDWLEVNRALNPAEVRRGQHGAGQWPGRHLPAFVLGLTKLCRHTVLPQCCPCRNGHQPVRAHAKLGEERRGSGGGGRPGEERLRQKEGGWQRSGKKEDRSREKGVKENPAWMLATEHAQK